MGDWFRSKPLKVLTSSANPIVEHRRPAYVLLIGDYLQHIVPSGYEEEIALPAPSPLTREVYVTKKYHNLKNAPIEQAIIDMRVVLPDGIEPEHFLSVAQKAQEKLPNLKMRSANTSQWGINSEGQITAERVSNVQDGVAAISEDGKTVAQFRRDGFTFNRLRPYTSWDQLAPTALELWEQYKAAVDPISIRRLSVQNFNRYETEVRSTLLEDYFSEVFPVPRELPQDFFEYDIRFSLLDKENDTAVGIRCALEPGVGEGKVTIVLDIDAYSARISDSKEIPIHLEKLHELKNKVFFNMMTEAALEEFK